MDSYSLSSEIISIGHVKKVYENIIRSHAIRKTMKPTDDNYANLEVLEKKRKIDSSDDLVTLATAQSVASASDSMAVVDDMALDVADDPYSSIVRALSPNEAKNIFTALRKAANHPLLLRVRYVDEETLNLISTVALSMGHFGKHCDKLDRIRAEIEKFSDYDIHRLCLDVIFHINT